jgi:diacylglycerol O-acyltransferase
MRMLSALDASFIYLESDHSPMHIGSLHLIDARDAPGHFDYGRFVAHVARRLRRSRVFRERLVEAPFGLTHPCWINDPDFDLGRHLSRLQLPPPGGISQLMQLCSQLFGQSLSRDRPLWEMHFVEGLNAVDGLAPQSFAIVAKVHHAAVDGVSGMELMGALLDDSASPEDRDEADPWQPEQVPAVATMLEAAYARLASRPAALRKLVGELVAGARKIHAAGTAGKVNLPPMPFHLAVHTVASN